MLSRYEGNSYFQTITNDWADKNQKKKQIQRKISKIFNAQTQLMKTSQK